MTAQPCVLHWILFVLSLCLRVTFLFDQFHKFHFWMGIAEHNEYAEGSSALYGQLNIYVLPLPISVSGRVPFSLLAKSCWGSP